LAQVKPTLVWPTILLAMSTADEIRREILAEEERLTEERRKHEDLKDQYAQATERQRLRRHLDALIAEKNLVRQKNGFQRMDIAMTNSDRAGPYKPEGNGITGVPLAAVAPREEEACIRPVRRKNEMHISCVDDVRREQYVWKIEGMSWLNHALAHYHSDYAESDTLQIGDDDLFDFVYHPQRGAIGTASDERPYTFSASLAIRCCEETGSTFRYKIFIQRNDGEFIQWGPEGDEYKDIYFKTERLFGPDVQDGPGPADGIFGLTHEALLQSEWVHNDTLTVKFELEVRECNNDPDSLPEKGLNIQVPPSSLGSNLLSMLEEGKCSDVVFVVNGETLMAHSQVLVARCELFEKQLQSGMSESVSKKIVVDDCEPGAFKAFLKFLYSDDFSQLSKCMKKYEAKAGDSSGGSDAANTSAISPLRSKASFLLDVFSVSHKYQVPRLNMWCQQQLCDLISETHVCELLIQAHLCEARVLEETCLTYIKVNMQKVAAMPSFADLSSKWPELMMKISLFAAGVSSSAAASTVAAQQSFLRKRKRE